MSHKLDKHYGGWNPQKPDHRDYQLTDAHAPAKLPDMVDLRSDVAMPKVYDQGQLGSCTANAIGSAYEFELKRQGHDFMPSRLWIYYQERVLEGTVEEDAGAEIRDGLKVVAKLGVPPETDWLYDISTFTGPPPSKAKADASKSEALSYFSLVPGHGALRACLAAGFPFVFGFSVPESLESQAMADGADRLLRLPKRGEQIIGGHAVKCVGYDYTRTVFPVDGYWIKNSWGPGWCDRGYFFMDSRYFTVTRGLASDFWTIRKTS